MRPNELLELTLSPNVAYHKFVLLHRKFSTDLFCFFEGKDIQYYFPRINEFEENHQSITCGNKKSVLEAYKIVKNKYPNYKTIFFVDADFDTNETKEDLYITISYSIENLYCTRKTLVNILKNEFNISPIDEEYENILSLFQIRQSEFHSSVSLFNLWYFSIKKKSEKLKTSPNISLSDKFPKDFIAITLNSVTSSYDLKTIKDKYPDAIDITEEELITYKEEFESKPPILRYRGKYEIEFFIKFLMLIIEDANKYNNHIRRKTKFRIDPALVLSQLSQYAETPECLKYFLLHYQKSKQQYSP